MTQFEYIVAFFSIVFGLALTHILAGVFRTLQRRHTDFLQLIWAAWLALAIVLNWWVSFTWRAFEGWTFEFFLLVVAWTVLFYALAVTLFPDSDDQAAAFERTRPTFLSVLMALYLTDIAITASQSGLFSPWYYLPIIGHWVALTLLALFMRGPNVQRFVALWSLVSLLVWSLVVRRFAQ